MFVRLLFFLWHILLVTASRVICCLYQHIDTNSTSVFVSFLSWFRCESCKKSVGILFQYDILYLHSGASLIANPGGAGWKPGPATYFRGDLP